MKRMVACGLLLVLPCLGQGRGNPIQLAQQRPLRKKVAAVPLIAHPADEAQRRVNAALQRINDGLRPVLKECDKGYADFLKRIKGPPDEETSTEWERKIEVTMAGPRYLSLLISDFDFCGGAHQYLNESVVVFDLQTGESLNWVAVLPQGRATLSSSEPWSGIPVQAVADMTLKDFYVSHLSDADCRKDGVRFDDATLLIWLDAAKRRVMLGTNLLPLFQACAEHVEVTVEDARRLGFADEIVQAVAAGPVH